MTFTEIETAYIETTWANRLAQEPLKNKLREMACQLRKERAK